MSSTLEGPNWTSSAVLKDHVVNKVSKLKRETDGDIVVYASAQLVRTLMEHDLVDELRLMIYPIVLGAGKRLSARPATRNPCAASTSASPRAGHAQKEGPSSETMAVLAHVSSSYMPRRTRITPAARSLHRPNHRAINSRPIPMPA